MSDRRIIDPFAPPPINESALRRAKRETGIRAVELRDHEALGGDGRVLGLVEIGDTRSLCEAYRLAARRTAETN